MNPIGGQANVRALPLVARADGSPITAGTVNYYLQAKTGANAGKWFRGSDNSWQAAEAVGGAMTHQADGHWSVSIAAGAWTDAIEYLEYAKESGDLHVPVCRQCRADATVSTRATAATLNSVSESVAAVQAAQVAVQRI